MSSMMVNSPHCTHNKDMYLKVLRNKKIPLVISTGPAGTGKTMLATKVGVESFNERQYMNLVVTRPMVHIGVQDKIGFLPGDLDDKLKPWIEPINQHAGGSFHSKKLNVVPLSLMRGLTFHDSWIIADEMQNSTVNEMKTLLTRVGYNSKLVITGDLEQTDLENEPNGLEDLIQRLDNYDTNDFVYQHIKFDNDDIKRSEFVKRILKYY